LEKREFLQIIIFSPFSIPKEPYCGLTSRCSGRRYAASKIVAFLKVGLGPIAVPIYTGGAAERQSVSPLIKPLSTLNALTVTGIF